MMRIITGKARGTRLLTLAGEATRPTAERVKEAVFSMLRFDLPDARVLDLFAGSGQLALEALSQGAESAVLCDASKEAVGIIRANAEKTRLSEACEILCMDAGTALARMRGRRSFDLVFLDPPYALGLLPKLLPCLLEYGLLSPRAKLVCETAEEADVFGNDEGLKQCFSVLRTARYGAAFITVLTPKEKENESCDRSGQL